MKGIQDVGCLGVVGGCCSLGTALGVGENESAESRSWIRNGTALDQRAGRPSQDLQNLHVPYLQTAIPMNTIRPIGKRRSYLMGNSDLNSKRVL